MISLSRLAERRILRAKRSYIIDPIFKRGTFNIIGGRPGIGKTTWLLQQLHAWSQGEPVLGCQSFPCRYIYITVDRSMDDTDSVTMRIGAAEWDIPCVTVEEILPREGEIAALADPTIFNIVRSLPDIDLYIIEGLQGILPDAMKGRSQNKTEMLWGMQLRDEILSKGKTVIAVTHTSKTADNYSDIRSRLLGSAALGGIASTVILFDDSAEEKAAIREKKIAYSMSLDRRVVIEGHDFAPIILDYTRSATGGFELITKVVVRHDKGVTAVETDESDETHDGIKLDTFLSRYGPAVNIRLEDMREWQKDVGISDSTFYRWVKQAQDDGMLVKITRGIYRYHKPS